MPLTLYSILIYPKLGYSYVTGHFTCRSCSHNTLKYGKGTLINMSDKMKGPGESDERMPDIEESQFSEGADNTPPQKNSHLMKMAPHVKKMKAPHF